MLYVTLNNQDEAQRIGKKLLERKLCNCVNWFPITCMYHWEGKIEEEPEVVLIVKTIAEKYDEIEQAIKAEINYTNCISQLNVDRNTPEFLKWLADVVE